MKDTLERLVWTAIAAGLGSLAAGPLMGVTAWQVAGITAASAGVNFLSILARQHIAALPSPGQGLPGLPTGDKGQSSIDLLIRVLIVILLASFVYVVVVHLWAATPR